MAKLYDLATEKIPRRDLAKNIWFIEEDSMWFAIVEQHDSYFYAYYYSGYWCDDHMWFLNYAAARRYLKREFDVKGRMKKVESNLPNVHNLSKKEWLR